MRLLILTMVAAQFFVAELKAQTNTPAERGKLALTSRPFVPAMWSEDAYENAWKFWDEGKLKKQPDNYDAAFREHYGLHAAPFENGRLPMGLREAPKAFGGKGITNDCMVCHGGSILGKSYIGLGNSALDIQALFNDLGKASGGNGKTPFIFSRMRGTSEAGGMAVFLMSLSRTRSETSLRLPRSRPARRPDRRVPAWWLLKKKKTMYHTGMSHARSVRSLMQFMLTPLNSASVFEKEEETFRDIQAFLLSLEAPKYPYPIDRGLAGKGEVLFGKHCAKCHGSYGPSGTYPNKIVPIDEIGTDRTRFEGFSPKFGEHYNKSWFAQEPKFGPLVGAVIGYQAPPLDGVWATAPYLHNGSVPTLYHMLNSKARPRIYTRSFRTDAEAFDNVKVGWKVQVLEHAPPAGFASS